MLVRLGSDSHNDVRLFSRSPLDTVRQLDHRDACRADQFAVFSHSVRDGDAVSQIGVRLPFASDHTLDIAGLDAARFHQHLAGSANGFVLVRGASTDSNVLRGELNHGRDIGFFGLRKITRGVDSGQGGHRLDLGALEEEERSRGNDGPQDDGDKIGKEVRHRSGNQRSENPAVRHKKLYPANH